MWLPTGGTWVTGDATNRIIDVSIGSCVRPEEASSEARQCNSGDNEVGLKTIEG